MSAERETLLCMCGNPRCTTQFKHGRFYRLEVKGKPDEYVKFTSKGGYRAVWGLSFYEGSWDYRTLGIEPERWLAERPPGARLVADFDRVARLKAIGEGLSEHTTQAIDAAVDGKDLAERAKQALDAAVEAAVELVGGPAALGRATDIDPGKADPLARYYTPDCLADRILERRMLHVVGPDGLGRMQRIDAVIDPHVGGGAFARAVDRWRRKHRWIVSVGFDVDPDAEGLRLVDLADVRDVLEEGLGLPSTALLNSDGLLASTLIVGNPPFSTGLQALQHVEAALNAGAAAVSFILPAEYVGHAQWQRVLTERVGGMALRHVEPILPRPWGARVRETCVYTWIRTDGPVPWARFGPPIVWKATKPSSKRST